jgi:hypothetical protein
MLSGGLGLRRKLEHRRDKARRGEPRLYYIVAPFEFSVFSYLLYG